MPLSYNFGFQCSICGIFIPYKSGAGLFKYFVSSGRIEIYLLPGLQLKNKNIFARHGLRRGDDVIIVSSI
ncbi:MAG TPA: hypothetical protein VJ508_09130, partial [Saprospiraceae bacterium]|nr:hypothetical protein [Saprospiraceae bacterium]